MAILHQFFHQEGLEGCKQGYTEDNIFSEFAKEEDSINKCNGCDKLIFENGVCTCEYISQREN